MNGEGVEARSGPSGDMQAAGQLSVAAIKATKKQCRAQMNTLLANIPIESIQEQSATIFRNVVNFKPYQAAQRIGIYLAMLKGEVQTDAIVQHALKAGKQVFVPYIYKSESPDSPKSVMDMVDLRSLSDYKSLRRDNWGIPTVDRDTVGERDHVLQYQGHGQKSLDMILMPGVAFDMQAGTRLVSRLGHGKGFYDCFLRRYHLNCRGSEEEENLMRPGSDVLLYGLALREQYLSANPLPGCSVAVEDHDSLLHGLFVGDGEIVESSPNRTI